MDIKKLRELRKKATPGLLRVVGRDSWRLSGFPQVEFNTSDQKYFTVHCEADARYLAAAWNILPEALDEIERLKMALQQIADYTLLTGEDAREMKCIAESALGEGN